MNALSRMTLVPLFVLPGASNAAPGAGEPLTTIPLPPPPPAAAPPDDAAQRNVRPERPNRPMQRDDVVREREYRQLPGDQIGPRTVRLVRPLSPVMPVSR
jgi:hypothetical protein